MPFRAKCPACGRKQSLLDSDLGHMVWCAACGTKFEATRTPEPEVGDNSIPDIDFPAEFGSHSTIAPPPQAAVLPTPAAPTPSLPPPPVPADSFIPPPRLPPAPLPQSFVQPEPIVAPPAKSHLVPILIALITLMGIGLIAGLATIVYLVDRPRIQTIVVTPPTPVITKPAQSPPIPVSPPVILQPTTQYIPPAPAREPVVIVAPPPVQPISQPPEPKFVPVHAPPQVELDDRIGQSIDRGVNFLLTRFVDGKLPEADRGGNGPGQDALAVYALLQAGEATHDLRLGPNSPVVDKMLNELKALSMDHDDATYSHSLRAAALSVYHRVADKQTLREDAAWLIANAGNGAYTYGAVPHVNNNSRRFRLSGNWDNSNSQYGALGVWASLEAGVEVPNSYWSEVQQHWLSCQLPDGEWAYRGYGETGRMSMTVAGITTLLVAEDQLDARAVVTTLGHAPYSPALLHGLNWLEAGDNSINLTAGFGGFRTYALFGLERAALASGFKYFGTHDWYRELALEQLADQEEDGSWSSPILDTSYTLLFLSRGRHPIFMNKLRFNGYWANRPRDIANLSHYASRMLERPINWQVVSLKGSWADWMDSPVLYIASHEAVNFTDEDCDKLRSFAENGGLIFTHADGDSSAFTKSIAELSHRLFPQYPLTDLASTHPIFSSLYKIKLQPRLQGISNGSRLLLVHSLTDINKPWQQSDWAEHPASLQMGMNIFIYAAGKANLRNKLKTPLVPEPTVSPILTKTIAELRYRGNYNPEPVGLSRFARLFLTDTSVKLNVIDAEPSELNPQKITLAHLTGTGTVPYDSMQLKVIHDYVDNGGILVIDACGASSAFMKSMLLDFLPHAFPDSPPRDMPSDNPILRGIGAGMSPVTLRLRPYRTESDGATQQPIQFFILGKGMVILSPIDLTTGFLGTSTWGVNGYDPAVVYDLVRNVLLYSLEK